MSQERTEKGVRYLAGGLLVAFSVTLGWASASHVWSGAEPLTGVILGAFGISGLALPLLAGGLWLWRSGSDLDCGDRLRVLGWCSLGTAPLVTFALLIIAYQRQHGVTLAEPFVVVLWVAGAGAVGGLLTGVYDVRRQHSSQRHRAAANRLSGIIEAAPVPVIEHDPDGTVRRWNGAAKEAFGWPGEEVVGEELPFLGEKERSQFARLRDRVMDGEQLKNVEIRRETSGGELRDFLLSATPIYDGHDGEPTSIISVLVDVTQQKQQREQLELFRSLLDHSNDAIFLVDLDTGEFVDVNETACEQLGYDREELLEQSVIDIETTLTSDDEWDAHAATIREDGSVLYEGEQQCANGDTLPVEVNISYVELDREYSVAVARDVSERKKRERDLKRFQKAIDHAGHAIYITDTDGTIEYANPAFEEVTGYAPHEVVGEDPSILQSGEHDEEYYQRLWTTILDGDVWEEDIVNQRKSGELYTAHQTIAPIHDDGAVVGFVAIQNDKTSQQMQEQRISVLTRVLRHNLRSSLNVIGGHAEALLQTGNADDRTHAVKILEKAEELEQLGEKSHTIAETLDGSSLPINPEPMTDVIEDVVEEVTDADLTVEYPTEAPSVDIDANVKAALAELVENAIEHSDQPEPSVEITATVEQEDDQLSIAVADDGPGIPEMERRTLEEGSETQLQHGSGLGLWLVKWLTTALGGKVDIDDNDPRGSVVTVTVPIVSQGNEAVTAESAAHPRTEKRRRTLNPGDHD